MSNAPEFLYVSQHAARNPTDVSIEPHGEVLMHGGRTVRIQ